MKNLPIGVQDFKKIIEGNAVYVDKTKYIYKLVSEEANSVYFLSRPRRFGKSLMVSLLNYLFEGEEELFRGLYIHDKWNWGRKYPVLRFDMSSISTDDVKKMEIGLRSGLKRYFEKYEIEYEKEKGIKDIFTDIVIKVSEKAGEKVVILIDEYDKLILDKLEKKEDAGEVRELMRNFYGGIKALDPYLRFVFLTGITKFSKVSVFSELNNLNDISIDYEFNAVAGLTLEEIERDMGCYIERAAGIMDVDRETFLDKMRDWYNGYRWGGREGVYNPFSVLNMFWKERFKNYWFESGGSKFITMYVAKREVDIGSLENSYVSEGFDGRYNIEEAPPESFLFQAGYLTIKRVEEGGYILGIPNLEVKKSLSELLVEAKYFDMDSRERSEKALWYRDIYEGMGTGDVERVIENVKRFFECFGYYGKSKEDEWFYHSHLVQILWGAGVNAKMEEVSRRGRSDIEVERRDKVYVIEVKVNSSAEEALEQIERKGYYKKYENTGKKILKVGINFSTETGNIDDWKIVPATETTES